MISLIDTINEFTLYVSGGKPDALTEYMQKYSGRVAERVEHFYLTKVDSDKKLVESLENFLISFQIPKQNWVLYFAQDYTVHQFLVEVKKRHSKRTNVQIDHIIELVEGKKRFFTSTLLINLVLAIIGLTALMFLFPPAFTLFKLLISPSAGLPYWGLFYTTAYAVYEVAQSYYENKKTVFEHIRDSLFLGANAILNILAYSFWIAAAAPMGPLVAILFVSASAINVFKEVFYTIQTYLKYKNTPANTYVDPISAQQGLARLEFGYKRHRNAAIINLCASLILLGLMTAWCLVPGGALFIAGIIAAIFAVQFIKNELNKYNEAKIRENLADRLMEIVDKTVKYNAAPSLDSTINGSVHSVKDDAIQVTSSQKEQVKSQGKSTICSWFSFFSHSNDASKIETPGNGSALRY